MAIIYSATLEDVKPIVNPSQIVYQNCYRHFSKEHVTKLFYFTKKKFHFAKLVTLFVVWNVENMLDILEGGEGVNETLYRA